MISYCSKTNNDKVQINRFVFKKILVKKEKFK